MAPSLRPAVIQALQQDFYTSNFAVRNVEIVGPQVGRQLGSRRLLATLYSLAGMLVYLWFRFELIYGVAPWSPASTTRSSRSASSRC